MRSLVPKLFVASLVLLVTFVFAASAAAAPTFSGAFKLGPGGKFGTNNKIVAGPDGNVWFTVETAGKEVAKITPAGTITEYTLPEAAGADSITVGPEGKLWLTVKEKAISFSPADPEASEKHFAVASIGESSQITESPGGFMWVASTNQITDFSPADPEGVNAHFTPTGELSPKDIAVAGSGLVVADFGHERLLTIGADGKQGPDIPLGGGTMSSQGVAGSASGQIAFSKSDSPKGLGLVTPPAAPTAALMLGDPFGVTTGPDGNYWFAMSAAHGLEELTPTGTATALAFPGFEKWFPRQITAGPGGTLWATMEVPGENEYAIAKVVGVEAPVVTPAPPAAPPPPVATVPTKPVPKVAFGKKPKKVVAISGAKATVQFTFSSSVAGSSFQCGLVKVPTGKPAKGKKKKVPQPSFSGCGSPKVLRVGPGKYRFSVLAVAAGVTSSPAVYGFKVLRAAPRPR